MSPSQLIDGLRNLYVPNDIVAILSKVSVDFEADKMSGANAAINCHGSTEAFKDNNNPNEPSKKQTDAELRTTINTVKNDG